MKDISNKKLLIVSGDRCDFSFVASAKKQGVYVICCDGHTDWSKSPAKKIADEAWNIDYSKTEEVAAECRRAGVDGVIAGYSENRVLAACRIARAIGTPFYATEEQINLTRNKILFKKQCRKYGINTPKDYVVHYPIIDEEIDKVIFPVIVKPSDNGGRKGISVCYDRHELESAVALALEQSITKEIVVEEFLSGTELSAVYTISDGRVSLSCLNDKYISEDNDCRGMLCAFVCAPSRYLKQFQDTVDAGIKRFLAGIGVRNGVANFQMIANDEKICVFEMGLRMNGNDDYKVISRYNGLNYCDMMVRYSLTGEMGDDLSRDNPAFSSYSCTLTIMLHPGKIGKIDYTGLQQRPEIYDISIGKDVGDEVSDKFGNARKSGMIKFFAETLDEAAEITHYIQENMIIEDEQGRNMMFEKFDTRRIGAFF